MLRIIDGGEEEDSLKVVLMGLEIVGGRVSTDSFEAHSC